MRELERIHRWRDAQLDGHFDPRPDPQEPDEDAAYEWGRDLEVMECEDADRDVHGS